MRKIVLTLAALAAFGIALPVATTEPANAETVIIKKQNRGHHYGWRNHRAERVVVVKKRHRHHHNGGAVIMSNRFQLRPRFRVQSRPPRVGSEWAYPCSA